MVTVPFAGILSFFSAKAVVKDEHNMKKRIKPATL
jgi:hypothetical protein